MDGDIVVGVLMVVFWLISTLISRFSKTQPATELEQFEEFEEFEELEARQTTAAPQGTTMQRALQELAEQMGLEVGPAEAPVASEHTLTGSEHRQAAFETRATASERTASISEHQRTASETLRTASETAFTASEHQLIASEHVRGDLKRARLAKSVPAVQHEKSAFAKAIVADLTGAQDSSGEGRAGSSLARAMVLKEILGPPVGLRSPDQDLR